MALNSLITLQGTLFLLAAIGVIFRKKDIITEPGKAVLTDLVLDLVLPCNIINSFRMEFNLTILMKFLIILLISVLIQVGCLILSLTMYRKQLRPREKVLQYATVCSNAGFMGNPIAEGVFGATGLMYASVYLIPQRIVMWTAGISCFTESPDRKSVIKKVATHPCIVAVYIGLALLIFQIPLPGFLGNTIKSVGGCTTALSMILIGTILADVDVKTIVSKTVLFYSAIRLILIPVLVLAGCRLFHVEALLTGISVLLAGMPAGSTTAILAAKYEGDYIFATKCVVVSTLLSLFTIPVWCLVLA